MTAQECLDKHIGTFDSALSVRNMMLVITVVTSVLLAPTATALDATMSDAAPSLTESISPHSTRRMPTSIPLKTLVERVVLGKSRQYAERQAFRYDIDTLGYGVAVRMRMRF